MFSSRRILLESGFFLFESDVAETPSDYEDDNDDETSDDSSDGYKPHHASKPGWKGPLSNRFTGKPPNNAIVKLPETLKWARKIFKGNLKPSEKVLPQAKLLMEVKDSDPQKFLDMLQKLEKEYSASRHRAAANPRIAAAEQTAAGVQQQKAADDTLAAASITMIGELLAEAARESTQE